MKRKKRETRKNIRKEEDKVEEFVDYTDNKTHANIPLQF